MSTELPKSPDDMPWDLFSKDPGLLASILAGLHHHSYVSLHWENNWEVTRETGEPSGRWDMEITAQTGKNIYVSHEDIAKLLWFTNELANAANNDVWDANEKARKAALAKLTPDEKRLLRLDV